MGLTGNGRDSSQIVTRAILQHECDAALGVAPSEGERLALGDVVIAVGKRNGERLRDGSRDGNETGKELHFDGWYS